MGRHKYAMLSWLSSTTLYSLDLNQHYLCSYRLIIRFVGIRRVFVLVLILNDFIGIHNNFLYSLKKYNRSQSEKMFGNYLLCSSVPWDAGGSYFQNCNYQRLTKDWLILHIKRAGQILMTVTTKVFENCRYAERKEHPRHIFGVQNYNRS